MDALAPGDLMSAIQRSCKDLDLVREWGMGCKEVATPVKWFEGRYLSPNLGWNPTAGHGSTEAGDQVPFRAGMCRGQGNCLCLEGWERGNTSPNERQYHCSLEMTVTQEKDKFSTGGI